MGFHHLRSSRKSSVGLMFALGAIPIIGLVGVAVDYGIWNQTNATMSVAANVAAMTAVKIAANAQLAVDLNAPLEGIQAGKQWFQAEVGGTNRIGTEGVTSPNVTVNMSMGATVSAQVIYSGYVPSVFGGLFSVARYPIGGQATAQVTTAPYLDVEMLLDNSSSMDIGATPADMAQLQQISACDPSNVTWTNGPLKGTQGSLDPYGSYAYSNGGSNYDGPLREQFFPNDNPNVTLVGGTLGPVPLVETPPTPAVCNGFKAVQQPDLTYAQAGPPCEFACHWDASHNSGLANDLYGAARRTLGSAKPIQLRFDLVKIATNAVLNAMQSDDLDIHNLRAGVFTFNTKVTQIYPGSGEASDNWGAALTAVGLPPTLPTQEETGILPDVGLRQNAPNDDTDIVDAMSTLRSTYLTTNSQDGTTSLKPRKVMFLITDGFMDDNARGRSAFPSTVCQAFKDAGYTVYVVFTPYYGIMHIAYLQSNWSAIVYGPNGGGPAGNNWTNSPGTLAYGLQQCASSASDYISATDGPTLNAALQTFLKDALNQPARFTN